MKIGVIDLITTGIPETTIVLITIIFIFYREKLEDCYRELIVKCLLSNILILATIYFSKNYFETLVPIAFMSTVAYIITLKSIWSINSLQSFLLGFVCMFFIMTTDILGSCPFAFKIIKPDFFQENRFLATFPTRIIQSLVLAIVLKFKITMTNRILEKVESSFFYNKITANFLLILFLTCVTSMAVYANKFFYSNLNFGLFIATIFFTISAIILLIRTRNYENYKNIFKNDIAIIKSLVHKQKNNLDRLEEYKKIIEEQIKTTKKIQKL